MSADTNEPAISESSIDSSTTDSSTTDSSTTDSSTTDSSTTDSSTTNEPTGTRSRTVSILRSKLKRKHEIHSKEDMLNSSAVSTRHLKLSDLKSWYSPEETQELLKEKELNAQLSDLRYEDAFNEFLESCQQNDERRIWTTAEDDFIKRNYKHLSDNTIALALNIPAREVLIRRWTLGLEKGQRTSEYEIPIVVWANRQDFDLDCARYKLTKARSID